MDEEIKRKILKLLDQHRITTIATLRPDGWPQATTVGYANEALTLYFLCGPDSQKAADALLKTGYAQYEMKQWDQAEATLNQVLQQYPDTTVARLAEGRLRALRLEARR